MKRIKRLYNIAKAIENGFYNDKLKRHAITLNNCQKLIIFIKY